MATSRCARLMLIAMANDLKEVWIAEQPFLSMAYLWQYIPTWAWWLTSKIGKKRIENFKSGVVRPIYIFLNTYPLCRKVWKFLVLKNFLLIFYQLHDISTKGIQSFLSSMHNCWFTINYYWSWRKVFYKVNQRLPFFFLHLLLGQYMCHQCSFSTISSYKLLLTLQVSISYKCHLFGLIPDLSSHFSPGLGAP